jgi:hypothetical protein
MRRLLTGIVAGIAILAWIWFDVSPEYSWGGMVKHELITDGFTVTDEHRVGHLALPWTWVHAPIKQVSFQRILAADDDGLIYGVDGYLRLDSDGKTEHAAWLRKIDCKDERFAQLSLNQTETNFEDFEQIKTVLHSVEWVSRTSVENKARWQGKWFDSVIGDYCL